MQIRRPLPVDSGRFRPIPARLACPDRPSFLLVFTGRGVFESGTLGRNWIFYPFFLSTFFHFRWL